MGVEDISFALLFQCKFRRWFRIRIRIFIMSGTLYKLCMLSVGYYCRNKILVRFEIFFVEFEIIRWFLGVDKRSWICFKIVLEKYGYPLHIVDN